MLNEHVSLGGQERCDPISSASDRDTRRMLAWPVLLRADPVQCLIRLITESLVYIFLCTWRHLEVTAAQDPRT